IFWALDYFKSAQAEDAREGDWTMAAPDDSKVPSAVKARLAFQQAMDDWDEPAADAAVIGLSRTAGAQEIFEIFCRYGARDFREIGHKPFTSRTVGALSRVSAGSMPNPYCARSRSVCS